MMVKKRLLFSAMSIVGIILLLAGGLIFTSEESKSISGMCFGFGSAILVLGIGKLIDSFIVSALEGQRIKRLKEIEVNDERNTRIREKAGYMAGKIMNYLISALVLVLGIMRVDTAVIIMVASLLLVELVLIIAFSNHYSKMM